MKLVAVEPIGRSRSFGIACSPSGCHVGELELDEYPAGDGALVRATRVAAGVGLREGARRLGMTAAELSRLERGAARFDVEAERDEALRALAPAPRCAHCTERPGACVGSYEGRPGYEFACDACCGHGCEDGWCWRLPWV